MSKYITSTLTAVKNHVIKYCETAFRVKINQNCNFVGLLHHPFWHRLVLALLRDLFSTFETTFWLRITCEGSVPEMRIPSMIHIVNFIRSYLVEVSVYISTTWWVSLLVDQWVPEGTWSQVLRSTSVDLKRLRASKFSGLNWSEL